jgi:hypothetical protein
MVLHFLRTRGEDEGGEEGGEFEAADPALFLLRGLLLLLPRLPRGDEAIDIRMSSSSSSSASTSLMELSLSLLSVLLSLLLLLLDDEELLLLLLLDVEHDELPSHRLIITSSPESSVASPDLAF